MQTYQQFEISGLSAESTEVVTALLSEAGFTGFEETPAALKAFIPTADYNEGTLEELAAQFGFSFSRTGIEETNWNQVWESNFEPILVDDFLLLRATFHAPQPAQMEIVITPKMSFGTGHHATTYMMVQQMRTLAFDGKKVFDFGTGTGVLAILAEKLGAADILAIDNDEWSTRNAEENCQVNGSKRVRLKLGEDTGGEKDFDIILANINRHVIEQHLKGLFTALKPGGYLLLSGLLKSDEQDILDQAIQEGFREVRVLTKDNWVSIMLLR